MKQSPKVGTIGRRQFRVEDAHGIALGGTGGVRVLATPWLLWFLEHAAREALADLLEPGEVSVGVHVDIDHLAATPIGQDVTCQARVVHSDGPLISFQLEAHDQHELISRGHHKRRVVEIDRIARRIKRKTDGS